MEVRRIRPDEWRELRALRLEALRTAPEAFVARYEDVVAYPDREWQERARRPTFVAVAGDRFVGMATALRENDARKALLFGMFVHPDARRTGVGRRLVAAVADWARAEGCSRVELGVAEGNDAAARLYESCGFVPTGERRHYDGYGFETRMAREL